MNFRMAQNTASPPPQVLIWNLDIGEPVKMIDCHTDVILCMSFNTDGSLLATSCKDKKLRVVEPRSGRVLQVRGLEGSANGGTGGSPVTSQPFGWNAIEAKNRQQ